MTLYKKTDEVLAFSTEDACEKIASQEEVYLEETEEELRSTLICSASSSTAGNDWIPVQTHTSGETSSMSGRHLPFQCSVLIEQKTIELRRAQATVDLLTGDSDDAPLSEQTLDDMLKEQN